MAKPTVQLDDELLGFLDALSQKIQDLATGVDDGAKDLEGSTRSTLQQLKALAGGFDEFGSLASIAVNQVTQFVREVQNEFGKFVDLFDPSATLRFQIAVNDLNASIGEALLPVFNRATILVRGLGDAVAGMSPAAKPMIGALGASAIAMGVMTIATQAFSAAVAGATGGISLLAGGLVGGLVAVGSVSGTLEQFQQDLQPIINALSGGLSILGEAFGQLVQAAKPLMEVISGALSQHLQNIEPILRQLVGTVGGVMQQMFPVFEALVPPALQILSAVSQLNASMMGLVSTALQPVLAALGPVAQLLSGMASGLALVGSVMATAAQFANAVLAPAFELLAVPMRIMQAVLEQVGEAFGPVIGELQAALVDLGRVLTEIGQLFAGDIRGIAQAAGEFLRPLLSGLTEFAGQAAEVFRDIIDWVKTLTQDLRDLFGLKVSTQPNVRGASEGKARRETSTGDIMEMIRKAQLAAFSVGGGMDDLPKQTAQNTASTASFLSLMHKWLDVDLPKKIDEAATTIANAILNAPKNAVDRVKREAEEAGQRLGERYEESQGRRRRSKDW